LSVFSGFGLIRSHRTAAKDRHHYQPASGQLIITNDSIAIVARFALASESGKDGVGDDWPVQYLSSLVETPALLGIDRDSRIYGLEDVIRTDSEAVV
jgi:hypothetical protein